MTHLDKVDLFAGLDAAQLDAVQQCGRLRTFAPGGIVVHEGDEGNGLFIVQSGALKVFSMDENGREVTLSLLEPGDYFGELALLDMQPRSASVLAVERSELLQIPAAAFNELIVGNPACMGVVVRNLVARVRSLTDNVRALALVDVFGRISRLFDSLAVEKDGCAVIERKLTQKDVASMVGASREMVNRILRDLVTGGYIVVEPHRIVLRRKLPQHW